LRTYNFHFPQRKKLFIGCFGKLLTVTIQICNQKSAKLWPKNQPYWFKLLQKSTTLDGCSWKSRIFGASCPWTLLIYMLRTIFLQSFETFDQKPFSIRIPRGPLCIAYFASIALTTPDRSATSDNEVRDILEVFIAVRISFAYDTCCIEILRFTNMLSRLSLKRIRMRKRKRQKKLQFNAIVSHYFFFLNCFVLLYFSITIFSKYEWSIYFYHFSLSISFNLNII